MAPVFGNGFRARTCPLPLPLVLGFVVGFAFAFYAMTCRDAATCGGERPPTVGPRADAGRHRRRYHRADVAARMTPDNVTVGVPSVLCVVLVGDVDTLLMQRNVWLDKCDDTVYASRLAVEYAAADAVVVTDTHSADPWRRLCRTLVRVHGLGVRRDWVLVAADNLWLIYENLVRLASLLDADERGRRRRRHYYAGRYAVDGTLATDAGVLLSADTLAALVRVLDAGGACDATVSDGGEGRMLDFYLRELNTTPVDNMDSYGCSLFNSINLFEAFDANGLNANAPKTCLSSHAISFQLDLFPNYYAMFYKYVLYRIRLVNRRDLMSNDVLPVQRTDDDDMWRIEALYELNLDPLNMTQTDFYRFWSNKRQIIL